MDGILSCVFSIVVGIVCLVIAILNMCGNISMLHSYHIKNIKETIPTTIEKTQLKIPSI